MQRSKTKNWYFTFSPGDWLRDVKLNACSLQAQGAWIRLLCYMHESEQCGYLTIKGRPIDEKGIKNLLGVSKDTFESIWEELIENDVIKRDPETNAFYSKRMAQDYAKFIENTKGNNDTLIKYAKVAESVILHLNKVAEKDFNPQNPDYIKLIYKKIVTGYKEEDFKKVINYKCEEWLTNLKMNQFLQPSTLLGDKFEYYLTQAKKNEPKAPVKKHNPYNDMNR